MAMKSLITGKSTTLIFQANILKKYPVSYYRCDETGFIQTEQPYWLDEAYSTAITDSDIGLVTRNMNASAMTIGMIEKWNWTGNRFLDFGGGYGLFTRLMRDAGFPFLHYDERCSNLFAVGFEADFTNEGTTECYDLLTAWEVFEHFADPIKSIQQLTERSERVLFSTILVPSVPLVRSGDWWYFMPETGQHIAFYTVDALRYVAIKLGLSFYTDGTSYHLFTRKPLPRDPFRLTRSERIFRRCYEGIQQIMQRPKKRASLLEADYRKTMGLLVGNATEQGGRHESS